MAVLTKPQVQLSIEFDASEKALRYHEYHPGRTVLRRRETIVFSGDYPFTLKFDAGSPFPEETLVAKYEDGRWVSTATVHDQAKNRYKYSVTMQVPDGTPITQDPEVIIVSTD